MRVAKFTNNTKWIQSNDTNAFCSRETHSPQCMETKWTSFSGRSCGPSMKSSYPCEEDFMDRQSATLVSECTSCSCSDTERWRAKNGLLMRSGFHRFSHVRSKFSRTWERVCFELSPTFEANELSYVESSKGTKVTQVSQKPLQMIIAPKLTAGRVRKRRREDDRFLVSEFLIS